MNKLVSKTLAIAGVILTTGAAKAATLIELSIQDVKQIRSLMEKGILVKSSENDVQLNELLRDNGLVIEIEKSSPTNCVGGGCD